MKVFSNIICPFNQICKSATSFLQSFFNYHLHGFCQSTLEPVAFALFYFFLRMIILPLWLMIDEAGLPIDMVVGIVTSTALLDLDMVLIAPRFD